MSSQVLLIGAGAVGRVFGLHLQRAGAKVSFLVKPKHEQETRRGFRLLALHRKNEEAELVPDQVYTSLEDTNFDHVFLCVSSTGLKNGRWLAELAPKLGDATIAAIQPGLEDVDFVRGSIPEERIVWGMFPLVSFIEGAHTKYYLPPFAKVPWSGARAKMIAELFRRGGLPSRAVPDVTSSLAFGSVVINLHMTALEVASWSLAGLRRDRALLELLSGAIAEAFRIVGARTGMKRPRLLGWIRPWTTRFASWIAAKISPFPLEDYLAQHFSKVGDQTAAQLHAFIEAARASNISTPLLDQITQRLEKARSG